MNDQILIDNVQEDAASLKDDLTNVVEDSASRLSKFKENIGQTTGKAKEEVFHWVDSRVSKMSEGFEKMKSGARETVNEKMSVAKEGVGHGLSRFNSKAQQAAEKIPGGIGKKAASYPWVSISLALGFGLLLSGVFKRPCPSDG